MNKSLRALILGIVPVASPALAAPEDHHLSGSAALVTDYLYRGVDQSNGQAAVQAGADYRHASGLYAGFWGSSISWVADLAPGISAPLELDVYGGYRGNAGGLDYDAGVLTYNYPGSYPAGFTRPDSTEIYGAIRWKSVGIKYSHLVSSHIFAFTTPTGGKTRGSGYLDLSWNQDLGNGWGISAHAGHQRIKGFGEASYSDYQLGVSKDLGFAVVGLSYSGTNAKGAAGQPYHNAHGRDLGADRLVVSVNKAY